MASVIEGSSLLKTAYIRDKRGLSSVSIPTNDTTMITDAGKKMKVLLESLDVLTALAKMNSEKWQQTLYDSQPADFEYSDRNSAAALQKHFDHLQSQWKLEETSIPRLFESIHQFHSKCVHLAAHSDYVSEENKFLRDQLVTAKNRERKLETAVKKLHETKETLKKEIESVNSERESLVKGADNYARNYYEAQTSLESKQLENHERIMKLIVDTGGNEGRSSPMSETASASYSSLEDRLSSTDIVPCITNNGVATVRIENMPTEPTDKEYHTLHYPANSKVGIQFHPMQSVRRDIKTNNQKRLFPLQRFVSKPQLLLDDNDRPKEHQKAFLFAGTLDLMIL